MSTCRLCSGCLIVRLLSLQDDGEEAGGEAQSSTPDSEAAATEAAAESSIDEHKLEPAQDTRDSPDVSLQDEHDSTVSLTWLSLSEVAATSTRLLREVLMPSPASDESPHDAHFVIAMQIPAELLLAGGIFTPGACPRSGLIGFARLSAAALAVPLAQYCYTRQLDPTRHPEALQLITISGHQAHASLRPAQLHGHMSGPEISRDKGTPFWLQVTVNTFWQTVQRDYAKLSLRAKGVSGIG